MKSTIVDDFGNEIPNCDFCNMDKIKKQWTAPKKCLHCGKEITSSFAFCSEQCNSDYEWINGENK